MKLLRTRLSGEALVVGVWLASIFGGQAQFTLVNLGVNHQGELISGAPRGFFNMTGGGADIWDTWDNGAFAYQAVTGDFSVQVRVNSLEANARWTKAGLMVRESLSESARMVFNRVTPPPVPTGDGDLGANDSRFAYRTGQDETEKGGGANGGRHEDGSGSPEYPNAWLRLERVGNIIFGYRSDDGVNWVPQGSQDTTAWAGGPLPREVLVGLAVSKGPSGGPTATAEFREYNLEQSPAREPFQLLSASSEGNPNGIKAKFNRLLSADAPDLWHWAISPGTISNAQFGATADTIRLSTASPLIEGQTYTLTISGLLDSDTLDPIVPDPTTIHFTHGAGYETRRIRLERWNFIPGGSVEPILASQAYARNLPDVIHSNLLFEDTTPATNDLFSGRIFGVLNITNTGLYRFFACSDDSSVLYLGTDDQPASKIEIAREPEWNGSRQYATLDRRGPGRASVSAPIRLEAGKRYWFEQVFAEGYQGNNASVAWQPPGSPEPGNGALPIPASAFALARLAHGTVFYTLGRPIFLAQPTNQAVSSGLTATFSVRVDGTPPYTYQWQQRSGGLLFSNIPGATTAAYARSVTPPDNGVQVRCMVSNEFSSTNSAIARLIVSPCLLGIVQQPTDATALAGQTVTFTVGATGTPAMATYQWQSRLESIAFTNIPGATASSFTNTVAVTDNGAQFRCLVGNGCTNLITSNATLTVIVPFVSLNNASVIEGQSGTSAVFTASLSQTSMLPVSVTCATSDGTAVAPGDYTSVSVTVVIEPGNLAASFGVPVVGDTLNEADEFFLVHIVDATNAVFGSAVWEGRILNDDVPPVITTQPISQTAPLGSIVHFAITAINNPIRFQWFQNDQPLADETNATLTLANVQPAALAFYYATASNDAGSDQSLTAELQLLLVEGGAPQPGLVARDNYEDVLQEGGGGDFRAAGFVPSATIPLSHGIPCIFTNVHATTQPGEPLHCNVVGGHSMWSRYSRSTFAMVSASTEGSDFDTVLAVYAGHNLTPVVPCNNDCGNNRTSLIQFPAQPGVNYYLAVDGVGGATGRVQLTVSDALAPPGIVTQPQNSTVVARNDLTLSVSATGAPTLFYQWRTNDVPITEGGRFSGAASPNLRIADVKFLDGSFDYTVLVSNCVGTVISAPTDLTVLAPPESTQSPTSAILAQGSNATFRAAAIGTAPLFYRWQFNGRDLANGGRISGADTPTLTVQNVAASNECAYALRVTNLYGSTVSAPGHLWVLEPPFITRQPQGRTNLAGSTVVLAVEASGIHPLRYQWQRNGADVAGATSSMLTLASLAASQSGTYTVRVSDIIGATISTSAVVTVGTPPPPPVPDSRAPRTSNSTNAQELTVQVGANLTFAANLINSPAPAPAFQWYHNTKALFGQTNATLALTNLQPWVSSGTASSNGYVWTAGLYSIAATNVFGGVTSSWCVKIAGELALDTAPAIIDSRPAIRIIGACNPGFLLQGTSDLNPPMTWTNLALKCGTNCFDYFLPMRACDFRHFRAVPTNSP